MFPWESETQQRVFGHENVGSVGNHSIQAQIDQSAQAKKEHKRAELEADRRDDERVVLESKQAAASQQVEILIVAPLGRWRCGGGLSRHAV